MIYGYKKTLPEIYNEYVKKHQETGEKPFPDKLLALLLIQEKEKYAPKVVSEGEFYNTYKKEIDEKIEKVITDFDLTKEDIINFIEHQGICYEEETYEKDRIWYGFAEGFGSMHWSLMYHINYPKEQVYLECFGTILKQYQNGNIQNRKGTMKKYKQKVRRKNGNRHNEHHNASLYGGRNL